MMKIINLSLLTLSILFLSACGTDSTNSGDSETVSGGGTTPYSIQIPAITTSQKEAFLSAINNARNTQQDCGVYGIFGPVSALGWNEKLYKAAYIYSFDMDQEHGNAWGHIGSNTKYDIVATSVGLNKGSVLRERVDFFDYSWRGIGENIAKGQSSVASVIAGWIDSDSHCKNLMNANFTEVGMALYVGKGTAYNQNGDKLEIDFNYWTQDFGRPLN